MKKKQEKSLKDSVLKDLKSKKNDKFAKHHAKFFQTHKGGYGEGDLFLGLTVPQQRETAKKYYKEISLKETEGLLKNPVHEVRLTALMILAAKYEKASREEKNKIAKIYLRNTQYINNWDLVDLSAPQIAGEYWHNSKKDEMWKFAKSKKLWNERIAMISTFYSIKNGSFDDAIKLAEHFLGHKHDLMHKAAGWMLREAGKRDINILYAFLDKHYKVMPRTMLRYSIEKLSDKERRQYMAK